MSHGDQELCMAPAQPHTHHPRPLARHWPPAGSCPGHRGPRHRRHLGRRRPPSRHGRGRPGRRWGHTGSCPGCSGGRPRRCPGCCHIGLPQGHCPRRSADRAGRRGAKYPQALGATGGHPLGKHQPRGGTGSLGSTQVSPPPQPLHRGSLCQGGRGPSGPHVTTSASVPSTTHVDVPRCHARPTDDSGMKASPQALSGECGRGRGDAPPCRRRGARPWAPQAP